MCGRFNLRTPASVLAEQFGVSDVPELPLRYNIAPTQDVATIRLGDNGREFSMMRWGLIPSWAKDEKIGNRMINARSETAASKPSFRAAFKRRRCLIPTNGFFEWQKTGGKTKQPYHIHLADDSPFAFAGLWERWQDVESCTILTTEANDLLRELHDRMPVILPSVRYGLWLDPEVPDDEVQQFLEPYPADEMVAEPVGTVVNNPRNDVPECVEAVS